MQLGDQDYFFVNQEFAGKVLPPEQNNLKSGWANYGGDKVWPGPEGWSNDAQWPSIPYYILDGSKYDSEITSNNSAEVAVKVTSPKDPRTGGTRRSADRLCGFGKMGSDAADYSVCAGWLPACFYRRTGPTDPFAPKRK